MRKLDGVIERLKQEQKVLTIIKKYSLSPGLVAYLSIAKYFDIPCKTVAQKYGIHLKTVKLYYTIFGKMKEGEYNQVLNFYSEGGGKVLL